MCSNKQCGHEYARSQLSTNPTTLSASGALSLHQSIKYGPAMATLVCSKCATKFTRRRTEALRNFRRYGPNTKFFCSKSCAQETTNSKTCSCGRAKSWTAQTCQTCHLEGKLVELTCQQCSTAFMRTSSEVKKSVERNQPGTYCSRTCYDLYRVENPPQTVKKELCLACKNPLRGKQKRFCSKKCYHTRKPLAAEYSGDWSAARKRVVRESQGKCASCYKTNKRNTVHHIDHDATNNALENLVLLCEPCHNHYHRRTSEPLQAILRDYFHAHVKDTYGL